MNIDHEYVENRADVYISFNTENELKIVHFTDEEDVKH